MRTAPERMWARPAMMKESRPRSQNHESPAGFQSFVFFALFSLRWWSMSLDAMRQNSFIGIWRIETGLSDGNLSQRATWTSKRVW